MKDPGLYNSNAYPHGDSHPHETWERFAQASLMASRARRRGQPYQPSSHRDLFGVVASMVLIVACLVILRIIQGVPIL